MRLLHVSDWHIGRQTYRCSRVPDHEAALTEIVELAREARPHLVLHTGDVFDGFRPGYAEMAFAVEALEELAAQKPGVEKVYALQAGREIRVIVHPGEVDDDGAVLLSHEIAREIEQELEYPGQIKVTVIRESRAIEYAR